MKKRGNSNVAIQIDKMWSDKKRPRAWRGEIYGLIVHTTGSGLPSKARDAGVDPVVRAVNYYTKSHGTHYVNGWAGIKGGQLLQVANEDEQANGAGTSDQRKSVPWEDDLPPSMVKRWKKKWEGIATGPLGLFPSKYANSCYAHVEMPPCVFHHKGKLVTGAEPMRKGLRFTQAQHDAIIELAIDMAERNKWPSDWPRSGRFVCHEDVSPLTRHQKSGGWDPGVLRASPWFDWEYVVNGIEQYYDEDAELGEPEEEPQLPVVPEPVKSETLERIMDSIKGFFLKLFGR